MTKSELEAIFGKNANDRLTDTVIGSYSTSANGNSFFSKEGSVDNVGNRGQSTWKKAQYVIVSDTKGKAVQDILKQWKLVVGEHNDQYLIFDLESGIEIYDYRSQKVEKELTEIVKENNDSTTEPEDIYFSPIKKIVHDKRFYLSVGDKDESGSLEILDEDKFCFRVLSQNHGAKGIRTISKDILHEWINYLQSNPNVSATQAREALNGKTDNDKFEYGYAATFHGLARLNLEICTKYKSQMRQFKALPLQQIFYGAPGTGKSFHVDEVCKKYDHFRTTFHPDSDYSTFVGCYKPTMGKPQPIYGFDSVGKTVKVLDSNNSEVTRKEITYSFVPQSFTNAYIKAWELHESNTPVYLVVEEINRGNCAQIFGDLFQLLDRNDEGYSTYEITPDTDLQDYISQQGLNISGVTDSDGKDISAEIASGKLMKLPNNLYIWATMNTSDQSLFPIDSAFKRRWDWVYKPIKYSNESWKVVLADGSWCSWTDLQQTLNDLIYDATESEDKMLGDWFVRAENNVISEEVLVGKIIFYLWNDVAKVDAGKLFDLEVEKKFKKEGKENKRKVIFSDFYNVDGTINSEVVKNWLNKIEVAIYEKEDTEETESFDTNTKDVKFSKPEYAHILAPLKDYWGESSWYGGTGSAGNIVCQSLHLQVAGKNKNNSICVTLNSSSKQAEVKVWYNNSNEVQKLKKAGIDTFMQNYSEENNCIFRDFTDNTVHKGWGIIHEEFPFDKPEDGKKWIKTTMEKLKNEIDSKLA